MLYIYYVSYNYFFIAFGHTVSEIDINKARGVFEKTLFTMIIPEVDGILKEDKETRKSVVLFGVQVKLLSNSALVSGWDLGSQLKI